MDSTLNVVEVNPKATVVAIYSATEAEIGRRIEQYANVVPDCSTKDGIAFAKEARAAFREPRLLIEEIRAEKKKPYLEIGRLIDSEAKRITALVAPHEKTWDDAIKADETRKENEKKEKAQAEIRRVNIIRTRINEIERAPIDALTFDNSEQIHAEMLRINSLVIDELYAEFEAEANEKKAQAVDHLRRLYSSRIDQEAAKAVAAEAQKKLDDERAEYQAKRAAEEKVMAEQREALLKQQREIQEAKAQADREEKLRDDKLEAARNVIPQITLATALQQAARATESPKAAIVNEDYCVLMITCARRDASEFRNKYSGIGELFFVMEEIDSFLAATAPVDHHETAEA